MAGGNSYINLGGSKHVNQVPFTATDPGTSFEADNSPMRGTRMMVMGMRQDSEDTLVKAAEVSVRDKQGGAGDYQQRNGPNDTHNTLYQN